MDKQNSIIISRTFMICYFIIIIIFLLFFFSYKFSEGAFITQSIDSHDFRLFTQFQLQDNISV